MKFFAYIMDKCPSSFWRRTSVCNSDILLLQYIYRYCVFKILSKYIGIVFYYLYMLALYLRLIFCEIRMLTFIVLVINYSPLICVFQILSNMKCLRNQLEDIVLVSLDTIVWKFSDCFPTACFRNVPNVE